MNRNPFNGTTSVVSRDDKSDIKSEKIPSLDQPIPNNWVSIEDDFIMVYSGHVSHMAANCFLAPNSRLDDGVIWLLYLRGNLSRSQVIQFLIALDTGKHCDLPYVIMTPVQAFRLEPLNPSSLGVMTVDGELIPSGPLQATVLPSMLNVMTR
jgi:sphingosine kinase